VRESKTVDIQAVLTFEATLMPPALAGRLTRRTARKTSVLVILLFEGDVLIVSPPSGLSELTRLSADRFLNTWRNDNQSNLRHRAGV
jgi:hypothetical protein